MEFQPKGNRPNILRLCPKTEEYLDWKIEEIVKTLNDGLKSSEPKIYTMDSWFDSSAVKEYLTSLVLTQEETQIFGVLLKMDSYQILGDNTIINKQNKWHLFFQIMVFIAVCPTLILQSTY
jgi:hypothetical protein